MCVSAYIYVCMCLSCACLFAFSCVHATTTGHCSSWIGIKRFRLVLYFWINSFQLRIKNGALLLPYACTYVRITCMFSDTMQLAIATVTWNAFERSPVWRYFARFPRFVSTIELNKYSYFLGHWLYLFLVSQPLLWYYKSPALHI